MIGFSDRFRLTFSRLSSLLLLLQRTPVAQWLFPEANLLGSSAVTNSLTLAVTTVIGLGAYDSVSGVTEVDQTAPIAGTPTTAPAVPAASGTALSSLFQNVGAGNRTPASWSVVGTLPTGLGPIKVVTSSKTFAITGTPTQIGSFPVTVKAWENNNYSGNVAIGAYTIYVLGFSTQPAATTTINSGGTATLSCAVTGKPTASTLTYQWYQGASGTTTTPVGTNSASYQTPALAASTSYWVKITSVLGTSSVSVKSTTAAVTVNSTPAAITSHPASATINSGSTTTLSVAASGTAPFIYQWYQGATGTTTTPIGTGTATFTTPVLNATTSYWVKVTNAANLTGANSNTATVTVNVPAGIASQPSSATIDSGGSSVLIVSPSGTAPFVYQWYQGPSGTTTTPVGGDSDIFMTPALTATTSYWVKITNAANPTGANSTAAVITVRGGFDVWASGLPAGQNGPLQTPQNDGVSNLLKYAFNLDPTKADSRRLTVGAGGTAGLPGTAVVNGRLRIEYLRRKASTSPGVSYTPQCGSNLASWSMPLTAETVTAIGATEWERVVVDGPLGETKCYGRVVVTQVP